MLTLLERGGGEVGKQALPFTRLELIFEGFLTVEFHMHFPSPYLFCSFSMTLED